MPRKPSLEETLSKMTSVLQKFESMLSTYMRSTRIIEEAESFRERLMSGKMAVEEVMNQLLLTSEEYVKRSLKGLSESLSNAIVEVLGEGLDPEKLQSKIAKSIKKVSPTDTEAIYTKVMEAINSLIPDSGEVREKVEKKVRETLTETNRMKIDIETAVAEMNRISGILTEAYEQAEKGMPISVRAVREVSRLVQFLEGKVREYRDNPELRQFYADLLRQYRSEFDVIAKAETTPEALFSFITKLGTGVVKGAWGEDVPDLSKETSRLSSLMRASIQAISMGGGEGLAEATKLILGQLGIPANVISLLGPALSSGVLLISAGTVFSALLGYQIWEKIAMWLYTTGMQALEQYGAAGAGIAAGSAGQQWEYAKTLKAIEKTYEALGFNVEELRKAVDELKRYSLTIAELSPVYEQYYRYLQGQTPLEAGGRAIIESESLVWAMAAYYNMIATATRIPTQELMSIRNRLLPLTLQRGMHLVPSFVSDVSVITAELSQRGVGVETGEFINWVVEMANSLRGFGLNLNNAIEVVKDFSEALKSGKLAISDLSSAITGMLGQDKYWNIYAYAMMGFGGPELAGALARFSPVEAYGAINYLLTTSYDDLIALASRGDRNAAVLLSNFDRVTYERVQRELRRTPMQAAETLAGMIGTGGIDYFFQQMLFQSIAGVQLPQIPVRRMEFMDALGEVLSKSVESFVTQYTARDEGAIARNVEAVLYAVNNNKAFIKRLASEIFAEVYGNEDVKRALQGVFRELGVGADLDRSLLNIRRASK